MTVTSPPVRSSAARRYVIIAAKIIIPLLILYLVIGKINWAASLEFVSRLSLVVAITCLTISVLQNVLAALRWWLIIVKLPGPRLSVWDTVKYLFASVFVNFGLLSSVGGDTVRVWLAYRRGLPAPKAITSVVIDRVITMLALVLINILSLPMIEQIVPAFPGKFLFVFGLGCLAAGVLGLVVLDRARPLLTRYPWLRENLRFVKDIRSFLLSFDSLLLPTVNAIVGVLMMTTIAYILASNLGLNVSFLECLIFCPAIFLVAALPISIGGWGARETATVVAFGYAGVSSEGALVLSVLLGLSGLIGALPGWLFLPALFESNPAPLDRPALDDATTR